MSISPSTATVRKDRVHTLGEGATAFLERDFGAGFFAGGADAAAAAAAVLLRGTTPFDLDFDSAAAAVGEAAFGGALERAGRAIRTRFIGVQVPRWD